MRGDTFGYGILERNDMGVQSGYDYLYGITVNGILHENRYKRR